MSDRKYPNILRAVLETPWAIRPSMLAIIVEVVKLRIDGNALTDEEIQARVGGKPSRQDAQILGQTAIIPIYGTLVPKADSMSAMSGATPVDRLQAVLQDAVRSADVANILLDVNSPGGATDLIPEFAAQIRDARRVKPVIASANTQAASAAYWLASQASEFVASPSAGVGSIGVYAAHQDLSKQLEAEGVNTTVIAAGRYKAETGPWGPLTDEAKAHIQERVDDFAHMFHSDVAKGRKTTIEAVRDGYGEGRMFNAKAALKAGMIDGVEPIQATIDRMAEGGGKTTLQAAVPADVPAAASEPATVGLNFAGDLRQTLGHLQELATTAAGFADVAKNSMSVSKREQFEAIATALGELDDVRSGIAALLDQTAPTRAADQDDTEAWDLYRSHVLRVSEGSM